MYPYRVLFSLPDVTLSTGLRLVRALSDLTEVSRHVPSLASSSYLATATAASLYDAQIPQATASKISTLNQYITSPHSGVLPQ